MVLVTVVDIFGVIVVLRLKIEPSKFSEFGHYVSVAGSIVAVITMVWLHKNAISRKSVENIYSSIKPNTK
jgi:hypothetical protein